MTVSEIMLIFDQLLKTHPEAAQAEVEFLDAEWGPTPSTRLKYDAESMTVLIDEAYPELVLENHKQEQTNEATATKA
jgi:hypothetical protein